MGPTVATRRRSPHALQDIEEFLRTEMAARHGNADGPQKHIACISDKDVETAVAFMAVEFPMEYLRAFVLQILGEMDGDFRGDEETGEAIESPGKARWLLPTAGDPLKTLVSHGTIVLLG